jgi:hypothetical protein
MTDYVDAGRSKPHGKLVVWPYGLGIVLVLAWAVATLPAFIHGVAPYMTEEGSASGRMFGYFAGHAFLLALGAWLILNLPFIRWQGPHPLFFIALLAAAAAPELASIKRAEAHAAEYRYDRAQTLTGKVEVASVLWSVVRFGPQKDNALDAAARTAGEAGRVLAAWKTMAAGMARDAQAFQGQTSMMIGAQGPLSPAGLSTPAGVEAAKGRLAQAHKQIDMLTARADARFKAYLADIDRIAASSGDRTRIDALAKAGRDTRQHLDALWQTESGILAEADGLAAGGGAHRQKLETLAAREMEQQTDFRRETASATDEDDGADGG